MLSRVRSRGRYPAAWRAAALVWIALFATATGAGAEEDVGPGPVSLAAPEVQSLQEAVTATVTVITRDQIQAMRAQSVSQLLRGVPGLHVDDLSARGGVGSVYIRGGEANYTLVLIDGVPVNDPTNSRGGSFDFSTLGTQNIERIEIARGPLPASWGSAAMAGAIQIITRDGRGPSEAGVELSAGSFGQHRSLIEARGQRGPLDYSLSGSSIDGGDPIRGTEFTSRGVSGSLGAALSDTLRVRLTLRYTDTDQEAFPEASGGPRGAVLSAQDDRETRQTVIGLVLEHEVHPDWSYRLRLGVHDQRLDALTPGVLDPRDPFAGLPPGSGDSEFRRYDAQVHSRFRLSDRVELSLGGQARFEDGSNRGALRPGEGLPFPVPDLVTDFDLERDVWSPYAELDLTPVDGLRLQASARLDMAKHEGNEWSPRLGATYTLAGTGTVLQASWGEGFKLPSFFALGTLPPIGNPALAPETSRSIEGGLTQPFWSGRGRLAVRYFHAEYFDLIDFDFDTFSLVNRDRVTARGLELSLGVQPSRTLGLTAQASWVETDTDGSAEELTHRPEWRAGLALRWLSTPKLGVFLSAELVGSLHDASIPTGPVKLDAYTRVDATLTYRLNERVEAFLAVDNLLDRAYEQFVGFPEPHTRFRFGLRFEGRGPARSLVPGA